MKKIPYYTARTAKAALGLFLGLACCAGFASCSDDDDKDGGVGGGSDDVKTCYFEADGERYGFGYAYAEYDEGETSLSFWDVDMLHYFNNPDEIKPGIYVNMAGINFEDATDIPTGTVSSTGQVVTGDVEFNFEMETHIDLYAMVNDAYDDEDDPSLWYSHDWSGDRPSQMTITKTGGDSYRIEAEDMNLFSSLEHGIDVNSRQTTGSFLFEGSFTVMYDGRTRAADGGFAAWLKTIRERARHYAK